MTRQDLISLIRQRRSFLCVGLDTDPAKMPEHLRNEKDGIFLFNRVDALKERGNNYACQGREECSQQDGYKDICGLSCSHLYAVNHYTDRNKRQSAGIQHQKHNHRV